MKLTPIKVRGKAGQNKAEKHPNSELARKQKRKRREEEGDGGNDSRDERRRRRFKSRQPAAPIEDLPTEVLERIIFMSRNLNFLRCSLRLGYRFSSPSFLTELLEAAFAPTWDARHGGEPAATLASYAPWKIPGDPGFQGAVLACPWVNITLVLEAQQKWCRRKGSLGRPLERPEPSDAPPLDGFDGPADVPTRFEKDWEAFRVGCVDFGVENGAPAANGSSIILPPRIDGVEVHPWTKIPEHLLTGPFDWEKARFSFWLLRAGSFLGLAHTWSWELTQRGFDNIMALSDKQCALIHFALLSKFDAFAHWPLFLLEQKLEDVAQQIVRHETREQWLLYRSIQVVLHRQHSLRMLAQALETV